MIGEFSLKKFLVFIIALVLIICILIYQNTTINIESEEVLQVVNNDKVVGEETIKLYVKKYNRIFDIDKYTGYMIIMDERYDIVSSDFDLEISSDSKEILQYYKKLKNGDLYSITAYKYSNDNDNYGTILGSGRFYATPNMDHIIGNTTEIVEKYGENSFVKTQGSNWESLVIMTYNNWDTSSKIIE